MKLPRNSKIFRGQLDAAPFASVFFLLAIFLTLSSELVFTPGVRINLPEVPQPLPGTVNPRVVVAVDVAGQFYYESLLVKDEEDLRRRLKAVVRASPEPLTLEILADRSAQLEPIYRLMALAGEIRFKEILCVARSQPLPKRAERRSSE
ncbi:MAG: biopolymer transporter ExbD [Verrucomicrobia bacterium]|nr:biopolymer transporter ExbD [Verrucomicrobiota bacterium]